MFILDPLQLDFHIPNVIVDYENKKLQNLKISNDSNFH